jgi:hypothetical protein
MKAVRDRAAFDLDCPDKQVQVVALGERAFGATGCGQRASYIANEGCYGASAERCRPELEHTEPEEPPK